MSANSSILIDIQDITKTYRMGRISVPAVKGISLGVERGEMMAIIGPSGSGKSTIIRCIARLESIKRGSIFLDTKEILDFSSLTGKGRVQLWREISKSIHGEGIIN